MYRLHDIWGASQVHMKRHYHHYTISCKYSGLRCQKGLRNTSQVVRRRRPNLKPSLKKLRKLKQRVRWYFAFNRFAFLTFSVQLHLLNLVNFTLYCTVRLLCSFLVEVQHVSDGVTVTCVYIYYRFIKCPTKRSAKRSSFKIQRVFPERPRQEVWIFV